jgi:hypothetical protein
MIGRAISMAAITHPNLPAIPEPPFDIEPCSVAAILFAPWATSRYVLVRPDGLDVLPLQ